MSVCLCLVVSGSIIQRPVSCFPLMLVTCVVSADSVTGLETERTPRTEQRRGATNDPPPSVSSGHRASTDCYLNTEHSIGHCVCEIINNPSFENIKSDARGRRGWELRPLEWWQGSLRGAEPGIFYVYVWGFHACQNRFISSINIPIFDKRCINFRYWTFCVRAALRSIHLRYDTTSLADKCFHYNLSTTYLFWTVSASVHKTDTWWRRKSQ